VNHPAYSSVLDQIRPDEARILRLLATEGPQPRLEVHDRGYFPLNATPVARRLTMLGSDAGCRRPGDVGAYLGNLERLDLVELSARPVEDLQRYRLLEAEPHVEAATDSATWPKTVYGSVRLTEFGMGFCEACFPFEVVAESPEGRFEERGAGDGEDEQ